MALSEDKKQKIKEHLERSLGKFGDIPTSSSNSMTSSNERKQRIMDHIRSSKG